jgi:hypothetical protein
MISAERIHYAKTSRQDFDSITRPNGIHLPSQRDKDERQGRGPKTG